MINKDVCKSLERNNGNEILIWSWNNPIQRRISICVLLMVRKLWWLPRISVWPHSFSLIRSYVHSHIFFWLWRRNLVFLYIWHQILFLCFAEHLQGFHYISHFTVCPLNVPSHNDPLGLRVVQLVCFPPMIFCIYNHNRIVFVVCCLLLELVPFSDLANTFKP